MNTTPRRQFLATGTAPTLGGLGGVFAQLGLKCFGRRSRSERAVSRTRPRATAGASNWHNWSGIQTARAQALPTPASEAELQTLLARSSGELRAVGSGHSFTALVPTSGTIISLDRMSGVVSVDKQAMTATVKGGTRLGVLARAGSPGLGLRNQPDVDVQTIAGAISTGTHGTGATLPALHDDVVGLRIVKPNGEVVEIDAQRHPSGWLPPGVARQPGRDLA